MKHPDMKVPKPKQSGGPTPPGGPTKPTGKPEAFDLWLKRGLHQIYDEVAKEPIPEEILRLLEEDEKK